eukprot:SAG31_NODE_8726_length_1398_cov_6.270208_1_plen_392_part_10
MSNSLNASACCAPPGCIISCQGLKLSQGNAASGVYTMCARNGSGPVQVYCEMETDGGGWSLAMTVNPVDHSSVAYNNYAFWSTEEEYGSFESFASRDYKSPVAYTLEADEIMIQSVELGQEDTQDSHLSADIKGWRIWPTLETEPIGSWFRTALTYNTGVKPCRTEAPSSSDPGSTSNYDDIIRHGSGNSCIRTDLNFGLSYAGDCIRLTVFDSRNVDDWATHGFAACINCGGDAQQECTAYTQMTTGPCNGMDRAACSNDDGNSAGCHFDQLINLDNPYNNRKSDCSDPTYNYCGDVNNANAGLYYDNGRGHIPAWTSRFFVREETPLTQAMIDARDSCEHSANFTPSTNATTSYVAVLPVEASCPVGSSGTSVVVGDCVLDAGYHSANFT